MDEWVRQAEVWVGQAERWIRQQPPEQVYVAVAVVAVTVLLLVTGDVINSTIQACLVLLFWLLQILAYESTGLWKS